MILKMIIIIIITYTFLFCPKVVTLEVESHHSEVIAVVVNLL